MSVRITQRLGLFRKGVLRPKIWEPQAGHQLNALRYIREQLRTMRLGTFFQELHQEEEWQEPKEVEDHVWTEIRKQGFVGVGSKVRHRDLRRTWERKDKITEHVELLELGKQVECTVRKGA